MGEKVDKNTNRREKKRKRIFIDNIDETIQELIEKVRLYFIIVSIQIIQ